MDKIDRKIVDILRKDGRATYIDIGNSVNLSEGAVRKRIKRLMDQGIIQHFSIKLGSVNGAKAIILLSTDTSIQTSKISQELSQIPNVEMVYEITGEYDIAVIIWGSNIIELNVCVEQIRHVKGVINTNTMIILREW